ncbi:hypothetical protein [Solibacillus sp.]|uniref:beta strand repeat-containing protein n=1 Tax=Solibacillus sp. TaxID=1909654 RepID=UPI00331490AF
MAITNAQGVLADTNASQAQVDNALAALTSAITGLVSAPPVVTVDTSKLQAQLSKASALDQKFYTADSVASLTMAITNAQGVLADTKASQAQIDDALAALTSAVARLVTVPVAPTEVQTGSPTVTADNMLVVNDQQYAITAAHQSIFNGAFGNVENVVVEVENNEVKKIKALTLSVAGNTLSLENAPEIGDLTVTGDVQTIENVAADTLTIQTTNSALQVQNVSSNEVIIAPADSGLIAKRSLLNNRIAATEGIQFAQASTTSKLEITFAGNYNGKTLTIQRSNVTVDTNANAQPFSTIDIQSNDVTINANQLANVSIKKNVLATTLNADVASLSLELQGAIELSSDSTKTIGELLITAPTNDANTNTDGWISLINIALPTATGNIKLKHTADATTYTDITAAHDIFSKPAASTPATFNATAIRDGNLLGKIKFNVDSTISTPIYYKFFTASENLTGITATPTDATLYTANSSLTMYNDVTDIILYTGVGADFKIAKLTPPSVGLIAIDKSFGSSTATFKINTTYRSTVSVQEALKYFVILKEDQLVYSDTKLTGLTWKVNSNGLNYVEITVPKTINGVTLNNAKELYASENALSLGGSGSNSPSSHYVPMLKQLAKLAQSTGNPNMIRILLATISSTSAATFDSLFLKHYVDELVANEEKYTTTEHIKQLLTDLTPEYNTSELMSEKDLLLASAPLEQFEYSTAGVISNTVANGKLVFTALKEGSTTVRVVDAAGNATLVSVTVDANKNITKQEVLATTAPNGVLIEGNDDFRYVEVNGEVKIVATKLQNALAIIQTNKTDTDLLGNLTGVYVSNANGAYTITDALAITPQIVSYADLGLPNGVTSLTASKVGGLTLTDSVALYPRIAGGENIKVSDGTNSTALTVNTSFTDITATVNVPEIAKSTAVSIANTLKLEAIKSIDIYPNTTNVHVYESGSALQLFANAAASGSIIVKDIQDKSAILNFQATNTSGKIAVPTFKVVDLDLTNVITSTNTTDDNTGATIQDLQGSSLRKSGLTLYAVSAGTTYVTLSNGKQYSIEVKLENNQYLIEKPVAITNKLITAAELHMSDFDSATTANQTTQLYKISSNSQLLVSMSEVGTSTIILKSSAAVPQQTIIHVTKNASNEYSVEIDRAEITATDLGLNALTSVSNDLTTTARAVTTADKLYIYGFQDGERTFKVTDGSNTTVVNTTVSNTAGNYEITTAPVKHNLSAKLNDFELSNATFSSTAAHVKDGILYATGNGLTNNSATIEVPIQHKTDTNLSGFYTIKVSYNEATKEYAFEDTGVITFKKSISMDELGLTSLNEVIVPTGSTTTATINGDKLDISSSSSEETRIQVIGNESTATSYMYIKRDDTGLVAEVEKSDSIDVSADGLNGVTTSSYLTDMLRANVSSKTVELYALKAGKTTYTATDSNNQTVLINVTTALDDAANPKSKRTITGNVVSYNLADLGADITGTIIEGDAVRIYNDIVYAVKNNSTAKVLLSDGRIVQFTISANSDTHYEMDHTVMTNSLTVTGTELDLTGNLTATGHNAAILTKTEYGNNISVYGVAEGKTSLTISGANSKSTIVNFTVTKEADNSFKVEKEVVAKTLAAVPILIDPSDAALVRIEGTKVYGLAAGKVELLDGNEIKQITISVVDGHYTMSEPVSLGLAIYTASDLGFSSTSGLTIESNSNSSSTYAAIVEVEENGTIVEKLVAYSKLTGNTTGTGEIIVKSTADANLRTLVQVARKLDAASAIQLTSTIAEQDYTAFAQAPAFQNPALVRFDAVNNKLYPFAEGHTYATVGTDLQAIHVTKSATTGEYQVAVTPLTLDESGKTIAALPGNATDPNVVRLDTATGIIYATGIGSTKVQIDGNVYEVHVVEAANKQVSMTKTAITSSVVSAQQLSLTALTSATVLKGNANAIQFVRGTDNVVLYSNGASTAQTVSLLVEGTIGSDTTKYHAVINIKIAEDGSISEAKEAATALDVSSLGFPTGIDEVLENDQARAVWKDNSLTIYALEAGNTAFKFANAFVNTTVNASQTNLLQATAPTFVSTDMSNIVDTITNGAILTEIGTKVYAKETGTALVNIGADVYSIAVTQQNGHYNLTKSAAMKSVTFDLANIAGTIATAGTVLNGVETAISETSNELVIYATENTGVSDIMITSGGVNTLYHTTVTNGVPSALKAAELDLDTNMAGAQLYKGTNVRVDSITNKLYLLTEGNAVLKLADNRLINVTVTRINGELTATTEFVKYELKEAASFTSPNLKLDGTTLYAIADVAAEEKVFTTNYRIVASTTFEDGLYKLNVDERQMKAFKLADYGLTTTTVTAENTPADVAFAEIDGDNLIIYAGTVFEKATLKVQDTVNGKTTTLTFNVTNNKDGAFLVTEQASVNALKFVDMDLSNAANNITAEAYNSNLIAVTTTTDGLNITSKGAGTTSIVLKQGGNVVGLVNVIVESTDGNLKATAIPVSIELENATELTATAGLTFRQDSSTYYPTAAGNALFKTSADGKKATTVTVSKNAQSELYSIQESEHNLATILATDLGLATFQGVDITGSTVTKQLSADAQKLYLIGQSNGTAEIRVSDGTNVAVIVTHNGTELLPTIAAKDLTVTPNPILTVDEQAITDWTSNEFAQVRDNKIYALKSGKTVLEGTLNTVKVLMNVSIDRQSDLKFDIKPNVVKATFANAPTLVDSTSDVIKIVGNTVYAQKEGIVQIQDGTEIKTISVTLVDSQYKLEVSQPAVQLTFTAADLGISEITAHNISPIIGSGVISAKTIGTGATKTLVILAKNTGEAKLTINNGETTVYFAVTEQDSKLVIASPIFARHEISGATSITAKTTNNNIVRFVGDTIYALTEGSLIATVDGKLYNVVAQKVNGKLAVNAAPITVQLVGAPIEDVSAFMSVDANFLASAVDFTLDTNGEQSFRDVTIGNDIYRIVITKGGVMSAQKITQKQADIHDILPNATTIVSTNTIVTATVDTINGKKIVELTPNATGHEYVTVTDADGTQSIQLSVTVTGDANNLVVASTPVSGSYNFSHFNFYATGVTHANGTAFESKQGVIQVSNGVVTVYPGEPGTAHVIVKGNEGKQALYVLTVTAGGSFTFEPFTSFVAYNEFGFAPIAITQSGTATAVSEGTGLRITYIDETPTVFVVKNETNKFKTVYTVVDTTTNEFKVDFTAAQIQEALVYNAAVTDVKGNLRVVTHTVDGVDYTVIYPAPLTATNTSTSGSFTTDGKIYNVSIDANYKLTATELVDNATANYTTVTHKAQKDVVAYANGKWHAIAVGTGIYKVDGSYVQIEVEYNSSDDKYEIKPEVAVPTVTLADATSLEVLKGDQVFVDGNTVFGFTNTDTNETAIVRATKDGKTVLYAGTLTAANAAFNIVQQDLFANLAINSYASFAYSTDTSSIIRIEGDNVYALSIGTEIVTLTTKNGLRQQVQIQVKDDYTIAITPLNDLEMDYRIDTSFNMEGSVLVSGLTITFTEAVNQPAPLLVKSGTTATDNNVSVSDQELSIATGVVLHYTATFELNLEELKAGKTTITLNSTRSTSNDEWLASFTTASPTIVFKKQTN